MEYLQNLSDGWPFPILTAFLLGLLTALSPVRWRPTSLRWVISRRIWKTVAASSSTACFTRSGVSPPTLLGAVLIAVLRGGAGVFAIQKAIGKWGETLVGGAWF